MEVGKVIAGSQLLQKTEQPGLPTSAGDRSIRTTYHIEEKNSAVPAGEAGQACEPVLSGVQAAEMTEALNRFIAPVHSDLKFEFHEKLQKYYVTIINSETREVIKEVPPKKMLDMYASMAELLGFIVDEKL